MRLERLLRFFKKMPRSTAIKLAGVALALLVDVPAASSSGRRTTAGAAVLLRLQTVHHRPAGGRSAEPVLGSATSTTLASPGSDGHHRAAPWT